ncbi:hypothetical protein DM02DRAFT_609641 [Periconia macrospinosa]|uniref:Uncharacterized protein n=1 Tax=Periconia macrospinosa TaxID=97972 RepID=A0A2V1E8G8_9PLEO|nr:hypothetical protein DM02DRAFT_609641 [Periconia macrospinosa]
MSISHHYHHLSIQCVNQQIPKSNVRTSCRSVLLVSAFTFELQHGTRSSIHHNACLLSVYYYTPPLQPLCRPPLSSFLPQTQCASPSPLLSSPLLFPTTIVSPFNQSSSPPTPRSTTPFHMHPPLPSTPLTPPHLPQLIRHKSTQPTHFSNKKNKKTARLSLPHLPPAQNYQTEASASNYMRI